MSLRALLQGLNPLGGVRIVPVREFLVARALGQVSVERAFFAGLLLRNGVYKTTEPNRMESVLPGLVEHASRLRAQPLRTLDVACSSGVTTVELHRALSAAGLAPETLGTDLALDADYVEREGESAMLFDSAGRLLQVEIGNWASPWRWRPRDRAVRPALLARARRLVAREQDLFLRARHEATPGLRSTRLALLASSAMQAINVRFEEEDILAPRNMGPFHIIRAANILNRAYFSEVMLVRMLDALRARLAEGGLMLVLRTHGSPPVQHGTLVRRNGVRLEIVTRMGEGSEIEALLDSSAGVAT